MFSDALKCPFLKISLGVCLGSISLYFLRKKNLFNKNKKLKLDVLILDGHLRH